MEKGRTGVQEPGTMLTIRRQGGTHRVGRTGWDTQDSPTFGLPLYIYIFPTRIYFTDSVEIKISSLPQKTNRYMYNTSKILKKLKFCQ